uniref:Exonuclease domain-containing protein n=1 Tax=Rhodnius prolixus TaxID=13249 RepID=T1IED8_RHOPR
MISHGADMKQNTPSLKTRKIRRKENRNGKMTALYMISNLNDVARKNSKSLNAKFSEVDKNEPVREENKKPATESRKRKYEEIDNENVRGNPNIVKQNLSETDLKKLRELIFKRIAAKKNLPKLKLKEPGTQALIDQPKEKRIPLFLSDVQHLLLYSLHGHMSTGNIPRVYKVLRTMFPMDFLKKTKTKAESRTQVFSRTDLILSPWQMLVEGYPLSIEGELKAKYADYVYTKDIYKEVSSNSPMWALDCEMCVTQMGNELTRVSIINERYEVVYESLVKPYNPIINYVTKFSGITPQILKDVGTRLEDVQAAIREIMPPDVILIGHSLNLDLHALKMLHPYIIDTSVIFNLSGERMRKTKLKVLSAEFLGEQIQNSASGHDSVEDATACMKLVQAKLKHSIEWGDAVACGREGVAQLLVDIQRKQRQPSQQAIASTKTTTITRSEDDRTEDGRTILTERDVVRTRNELPRYLCANQVAQVQVFTTSLFVHLVTREKNCLLVAKNAVVDEFFKYVPEQLRPFDPQSRLQVSKQETNRAIVKFGRNNAPENGATLMYTSVNRKPEIKASKVDRLVKKLMKNLSGHVLIAVLLAGRTSGDDEVDSSNHGLLLLHLHQEPVPPIQLDVDIPKSNTSSAADISSQETVC